MRSTHCVRFCTSTAVVLVAATSTACAEVQSTLATGTPTSEPTANVAPRDMQLVDAMVSHAREGIELSRLGEKRATDPAVKSFALKVERDDAQDLTRLQTLRTLWFGARRTSPSGSVPGEDALTAEELKQLETLVGSDFDRMFVDKLIEHRRAGVAMANEVQRSAGRSELKDIADDLVEDHRGDIRALESERAVLDAAGG